jgi:hypothetical protein
MAPVAGGIADAQEDGLVLPASPFQGLRPPGVPIHRVMGVLLQIGAGALEQAVGAWFCHEGIPLPKNGPGKPAGWRSLPGLAQNLLLS